MSNTNTPQPWERQERETPKAYAAFIAYRDIPAMERSTAKAAEIVGKSASLLEQWSAKHGWVRRAGAWDDEQERIARELAQKEQAKEIRNMRKRHADLASAMLVKAARALQRLPEDEIKASDVSRMVDTASKLERISRGDVGEVVEERDGGQTAPAVTFYMPSNGRDQNEEEE